MPWPPTGGRAPSPSWWRPPGSSSRSSLPIQSSYRSCRVLRAFLWPMCLDLWAESQEAPYGDPPAWKEWNTPVLNETVIQANANVALLQPAKDSTFDYWLRLSTLEPGQPVLLPVKLAAYHRRALAGKTLNGSTTLTCKQNGW